MSTTPTRAIRPTLGRLSVGQLEIDRVRLDEVLAVTRRAIFRREPVHIVTVNLQFVGEVRRNSTFRRAVNGAALVVPDGAPLVWYSKLIGAPLPHRITGFHLFEAFAEMAGRERYSFFILGGDTESASVTAALLRLRYPGLNFAGSYHGRFNHDGYGETQGDESRAIEAIKDARPDFLFVALGCPKQELWIKNHIGKLGVPVSVGVGGIFDVLSGRLDRAPVWMQSMSMEWVYRLRQEPRRLWRRYILGDIPTAARLGFQVGKIRVKRLFGQI